MKKLIMLLVLSCILGACSNSPTSNVERISSTNIENSSWWDIVGEIDSEYWWVYEEEDFIESEQN